MKPLDNEENKIRLQTFIAHCGICSRRAAMDLIKSEAVKVNGKIILEPSFAVDPGHDSVKVNGKLVQVKEFEYLVLNKPVGYVTTKSDQHGQQTVYNLVPAKYHHLSPVGRLDKDSEGLLILTNHGDVAYRLTHPSFGCQKVYFVRANGELPIGDKMKLERGVFLDGSRTAPARIKYLKKSRRSMDLQITLNEGRNRQIRRMLAMFGCKVLHLKRLSHGPIRLGSLPTRHWRLMTKLEKEDLRKL